MKAERTKNVPFGKRKNTKTHPLVILGKKKLVVVEETVVDNTSKPAYKTRKM